MSTVDVRRAAPRAVIAVGVVVVLAHLTAAIAFGMVARKWVSGAGIGALLVLLALAHLAIPGHAARGPRGQARRNVGLAAVAIVSGATAGWAMSAIFETVRWAIVPLVAVAAVVVIGRPIGAVGQKALRLGTFGVAAGLAFAATSTGRATGAAGGTSDRLQFSGSLGVFCVLAGLLTHLALGRRARRTAIATVDA